MTLNDIVQTAQGGEAVNNLARQFGVGPEAAQAAVAAMIPAFSAGLQSLSAKPDALGAVLSQVASGAHAASFTGAGPSASAAGAALPGQIFGSPDAVANVANHVAEVSGVSPAVVQSMLPAVASILVGGLGQAMAEGGHADALGQLANAAATPGGLSAIAGGEGGLGGLIPSLFGSLLGVAQVTPQGAALTAGFAALSSMFVAGVQVAQANQASLNAVTQSFMRPPGAGV
jgi:hypothetical protein